MLTKQKKSPNWYAVFKVDGKLKWISLKTDDKKKASVLYEEVKIRFNKEKHNSNLSKILGVELPKAKEFSIKPHPKVSIDSIIDKHEALKPIAPGTMKWLKIFLGWIKKNNPAIKDAANITFPLALKFMKQEYGHKSNKTFNNMKCALSSVWKTLVSYGLVNYWIQIPAKPKDQKPYRAFTEEEITLILENVEGYWKDLVLVSLYTGLRLKDVALLEGREVFDDYLDVIPDKTKKHGLTVRIYKHPKIAGIVRYSTGYIFPEAARQYGSGMFNKYFKELLINLNIRDNNKGKASFHSLRKTFVTRCKQAGIDTLTVSGIVGHKDEEMTRYYNSDHEAAKAIFRLN